MREAVETYDTERRRLQPYAKQRLPDMFGEKKGYAWSDEKVRQYSQPERADFGTYVRAQGFKLD